MTTMSKDEKKKELKQDQKAHEAQAKADKLQRHALDNGKTKKAEKARIKQIAQSIRLRLSKMTKSKAAIH